MSSASAREALPQFVIEGGIAHEADDDHGNDTYEFVCAVDRIPGGARFRKEGAMRLATRNDHGRERAGVLLPSGWIGLKEINRRFGRDWADTLQELLLSGQMGDLAAWVTGQVQTDAEALSREAVDLASLRLAPPIRHPGKIWGIGLNYPAHAADLSERAPTEAPASFMKPDTAIIGPGDTIEIPLLSEKTTAEAELGIVIGRRCQRVPVNNWLDVVAGFTTIIDMTAEDILRRNPRYLTLSKSFDTFFSFGPEIVTPDEIGDVNSLRVETVINNRIHAENTVGNMTFPPDELVAFHSRVMTLLPGDIISTGTPGAVEISDGDTVSCRITGFRPLVNTVRDLKFETQD